MNSRLFKFRNVTRTLIQEKNFHIAWLYHYLKFNKEYHRNHTIVVVYTPGHVGTVSVLQSLQQIRDSYPVFGVHRLTRLERLDRKSIPRPIIFHENFLSRMLKEEDKGKRYKIVTLVRDPIARGISGFFQTNDTTLSELDGIINGNANKDVLINLFNQYFYDSVDFFLKWFEIEFYPSISIDVYAKEFLSPLVFVIYNTLRYDLLILKLETLDSCWTEGLKSFLNVSPPLLQKKNSAANKRYSTIYEEFKKDLVLSEGFLRDVYQSKMCRHFYSDEELERFYSRWTKPLQR